MFELISSGGWLMVPIILCSVISLAIIIERLWTLKKDNVAPADLVVDIEHLLEQHQLTEDRLEALEHGSYLGRILVAGLYVSNQTPAEIRRSIEEAGRHVVHELEKYLNALGTIAAITPLLGLLGTVIGMIKVFAAITAVGVGNPQILAGGISEALITTAAGLSVGIPSLMFHRYFKGKINELTVDMEQNALRLLNLMEGSRK